MPHPSLVLFVACNAILPIHPPLPIVRKMKSSSRASTLNLSCFSAKRHTDRVATLNADASQFGAAINGGVAAYGLTGSHVTSWSLTLVRFTCVLCVCPNLFEKMGIWHNWQGTRTRWWNTQIKVDPSQVFDDQIHPLQSRH